MSISRTMNNSTEDKGPKKKVPLWSIFAVFAKIGAFTIGGGYAMIPIIQDELTRRKWMKEEELPDIIALSQSAPGVLAVNMSIFSGYRLRGLAGSIAATIGSVLPSFLIILLIAMFMSGYQDNEYVMRAFNGIRPVVISLIAVPMINMARKNNKTWWAWALSIVTLLLVAFLDVSPIYILLVVMVLSFSLALYRQNRDRGRGKAGADTTGAHEEKEG